MAPYQPPEYDVDGFNCPRCDAFAHQIWFTDAFANSINGRQSQLPHLSASFCEKCKGFSYWVGKTMLFPPLATAPMPTVDMPPNIKADYHEARCVADKSPRSAAALLRLAIQKLMAHLGAKGKDLNDDIASLVKRGLPVQVQQSLDVVRVIGNNAVHPGVIDLNDEPETVTALFGLLNVIVEVMITQPRKIEELYVKLPPTAHAQIAKRDGKA